MFSHIFVGIADFDRALAFYQAVMPALGIEQRFCDPERPWAGWQTPGTVRPFFLIGKPYDGQPHHVGNGQMVAFAAADRATVDRVHRIALANGGTSEGAPGPRPEYHAHYYGAYFRATEGNKLCVACHSLRARAMQRLEPRGPASARLRRWGCGMNREDCRPMSWQLPLISNARQHLKLCIFALAAFSVPALAAAAESQCYGTVSNGRIERSVKLPLSGTNFSAYSTLAAAAGRTHVHSKVAAILEASYKALATTRPESHYVYGETGWPSGGRFRPHRTHQNGLSVDFFVPVKDGKGQSVPLPTNLTDKLGYDLDFSQQAKYGEYTIDFEALAEHLYQLDVAAKAAGSGLALVIFDTQYLPRLFATKRGAYIKDKLPFMKGKPWVRHDEHYHVDFVVSCKQ